MLSSGIMPTGSWKQNTSSKKTTRRVTMMQPCVCAAPYKQSMSHGTCCLTSVPNTGPERERHYQTLVTGQLKYSWESVLSLNICDTGKKSHKQPESCHSKERTTWCERRQKQEVVARLTQEHVTGCSCQVRITSRQARKEHTVHIPNCSVPRESFGKEKAYCPLRHEHRGVSVPVWDNAKSQQQNQKLDLLSYSQVF